VGRLDGLTVDDRGAGGLLAAQAAAKHVAARVVNPHPRAIAAPTREESVDGLPVGKLARQKSPRATGAREVEDPIDDGTAAHCLPSAPSRRLRQQFSKDLPLLVGHIRGIFRELRVGHRYDSFRSVMENKRASYRFLLV
jgi:hypothetical protein